MILIKIYVVAFVVLVIACIADSLSKKGIKQRAKGGYFGPRKIVYSGGGGSSARTSYSGGSYSDSTETAYSAGEDFNMGYDNGPKAPEPQYTDSQEAAAYSYGYWGAEDFEQTTGMNIDDMW